MGRAWEALGVRQYLVMYSDDDPLASVVTLTPAQLGKIVMPRLKAQLFGQFEASEANGGLRDVGDNVLHMQIPLGKLLLIIVG